MSEAFAIRLLDALDGNGPHIRSHDGKRLSGPDKAPHPGGIELGRAPGTGLGDVHFHDLRHTANTLAATGGATTRELMHRMGHSSVRAALAYQHLVNGRDHQIADYVDGQSPRKIKAQASGFTPADLGLVHVPNLVGADGFEPPTSAL